MSDLSQSGSISEYGTLSDNALTAIFTATGATRIQSIQCGENTGAAAPTLSILVYSAAGAKIYTKRKAVAFPANGTELVYNEAFNIDPGCSIRLQSGDAAGKVDWCITYDSPAAAGRLR